MSRVVERPAMYGSITISPPRRRTTAASGSVVRRVVASLGEHVGGEIAQGAHGGVLVEDVRRRRHTRRAEQDRRAVLWRTSGRSGPFNRRTDASELSSTTRQSPSDRAASSMATWPA